MTVYDWTNNSKQTIQSHSWFDINIVKNSHFSHKYESIDRPINKFIKCNQIQLFPTNEQKQILLNWMDLFIDMYNASNYFLNNNIYDFNKKQIKTNANTFLNFRKLRDDHLKLIKKSLSQHSINKHILDEAIKHNVAKHKTSISNFKQQNSNFFRIRNMKKDRRKKIIILESNIFSKTNNGFCISVLKQIKSSSPLTNIKKTSILQYDKNINKFILYVPIETETINIQNRQEKCGIDPGIRTFLTCYSEKEVIEIGNNCYKRLHKHYQKIDTIQEKISKRLIKKREFKKCMSRNQDKIKNLIKDLHFKSSNFLCKNFDNITLGKISTKSVISKLNNLNKISKRCICSLSHFKFREILEYECLKNNTNLKIVNEAYTTKTCSNCNCENAVGKNKIYNCKKCKMKIGRDVNGAINIFKK